MVVWKGTASFGFLVIAAWRPSYLWQRPAPRSKTVSEPSEAWAPDGSVSSMGEVDAEVLTDLFQHQVLEAMVAERRLSHDFAQKLRARHPSGFGVHRGRPIESDDRPALERLAAILRPSFAASRPQYDSPARSGRIPHCQGYPPHPGCPGLDRAGDLPYSKPGGTDEPLLWPLLQRFAWAAAPSLHPGHGQGRLPGRGLGGALSRRAALPAAASQLGEVAAQGV